MKQETNHYKKEQKLKKVFLLAAFLCVLFLSQSTHARESQFSASGNGPLYMNTYDYQNKKNTYLPESRMQQTIDWMHDNFQAHGFEYVCLDGWINGATRHTENGYITTHNNSWGHDWQYWANKCEEAGLRLGIYYPPYWIIDSVANDTSIKVEGTDVSLKSICSSKKFENWYLVDPSKPGAKEYVQGFIHYLISQKVRLLKADFLGNYEDQMGTAAYKTILSWLNEACGNDLLLSLSAPNNFKWGESERVSGDLIRLSQDCYAGGWGPFSGNGRGGYRQKWPQYDNAVDAFVDFSDLTGKNTFAMDADFTIAHSFANDEEIKSAVSLQLLAGAGLGIGDDFDSINGKEWAFQNDALLALNKGNFVAHPLSKNKSLLNDSQIWLGQEENGDWIIGFFNRENSKQTRTLSFQTFGLSGSHMAKDLWTHESLGPISSLYSVELAAHACQIIRISRENLQGVISYEAENATLSNGALLTANSNASQGVQVNNMGGTKNGTVVFNVNATYSGNHRIRVYYATQEVRNFQVSLNNEAPTTLICRATGSWTTIGYTELTLSLTIGQNTIRFDNGAGYAPNLDRVELFSTESTLFNPLL